MTQALHRLLATSSSSRSSDGNSSLLCEGGSTSQISRAAVELASYGGVVWPDSLPGRLVERRGGGGGGGGRTAADVV